MEHQQTLVKVNTYVDKGIANVIQTLNNFDKLCTIESCEGTKESIVIFKYDDDNLESMTKFIFEYLAPKLVNVFGDDIDILMRMNTLGNLQAELLIKKPILHRFNSYLKQLLCEASY